MRPSFLDEMSWRMAEVYEAVTDRILINLAHYFRYAKDSDEVMASFTYQARMLAQIGQVNLETARIIADSLGDADGALQDTLETAIMEALKTEEPKLRRAAQKGLLHGPGFLPAEVTPKQTQAFKAFYRQSTDKLNLVNTVMLESTEQAYRATVADIASRVQTTQGILNTATGEVVTGVSTWNKAMHDSVQRMVKNGLTGFIDHGGHRWSPEAYAAMDIRTTVFNTARAAVAERAEQYGADLYMVSSHNGARPLCYPWQGKVISRSDWSGEVEDLDGHTIHVYAQSETSYGEAAGLFGVNCKHYPMTFIPGFSTIKGDPQDPKENERTYAESQEQRRLERKLREERRDLAVMKAQGASEEDIARQKARVDRASDNVEAFCEQTGRARRKNREWTPVDAKWNGADEGPFPYNGQRDIDPNGHVNRALPLTNEPQSNKMKVLTGGRRNEEPLTQQQKDECLTIARGFGMPAKRIIFSDNMYTAYLPLGDRLYIGTDVYPVANAKSANSAISHRGALAHELIGHRNAALAGRTQDEEYLEEAQASIRASLLAPGLSDEERKVLMQDAIERLPDGVSLEDVMRKLFLGREV